MVYEYPTNYSNGTTVTGPGGFFLDWTTSVIPSYANGLILLIWLIVFGVTAAFGVRKSILVASFVTAIISIFFAVRSWINPIIPLVLIIVTALALIFGAKDDGGSL